MTRCAARVWSPRYTTGKQCSRRAAFGEFCFQHKSGGFLLATRTSPELLAALERAKNHVPTAEKMFEQRVSFVYGQQDYDGPLQQAKDEVRQSLARLYGYPIPTLTPARLEAAARAISAKKRGVSPDHPSVDATWSSYVGHARECIRAYLGPYAQGIEARSDATTKIGAAEGESPTGNAGDAQKDKP